MAKPEIELRAGRLARVIGGRARTHFRLQTSPMHCSRVIVMSRRAIAWSWHGDLDGLCGGNSDPVKSLVRIVPIAAPLESLRPPKWPSRDEEATLFASP